MYFTFSFFLYVQFPQIMVPLIYAYILHPPGTLQNKNFTKYAYCELRRPWADSLKE
jgi:hypothetical protein